ncbi:MAG: hypothetical protein KDD48_07790, partial [Bdellovibrionales bacterium]|nr:hypothetical protein [Bdellovibrionales bacterium]
LSFKVISQSIWEGSKNFPWNSLINFAMFTSGTLVCFYLVFHPGYLIGLSYKVENIGILLDLINHLFYAHPLKHLSIIWGLFILMYLFLIGAYFVGLKNRLQNKIRQSGLKNGKGLEPVLKRIENLNSIQKRLVSYCPGLSCEEYKKKWKILEAALEEHIEDIKELPNPAYVEIILSKHRMPELSHYSDTELSKEYSFRVGQGRQGWITWNLKNLPHMLIVGTTGGGKSMFFRQLLLGAMEISNRFQLYLIDLKKGVEMSEFEELPNVFVSKSEWEAVSTLQKIVDEMSDRFVYMKKNKIKNIDPKRDKMDRILVGIDEASVLYTHSPGRSKGSNKLADQARELTNQVAKLGRAAGIHLVLATQKVSRFTIDTHIQENIQGRMVFKHQTTHGSANVLGSAEAAKLPDISGRGYWFCGSEKYLIQAPYISDEEFTQRLSVILEAWKHGQKFNEQGQLEIETAGTMKQVSVQPDSNKGHHIQ